MKSFSKDCIVVDFQKPGSKAKSQGFSKANLSSVSNPQRLIAVNSQKQERMTF